MRPCPPACAQTGGCGEKVIFVLNSAGLVWIVISQPLDLRLLPALAGGCLGRPQCAWMMEKQKRRHWWGSGLSSLGEDTGFRLTFLGFGKLLARGPSSRVPQASWLSTNGGSASHNSLRLQGAPEDMSFLLPILVAHDLLILPEGLFPGP